MKPKKIPLPRHFRAKLRGKRRGPERLAVGAFFLLGTICVLTAIAGVVNTLRFLESSLSTEGLIIDTRVSSRGWRGERDDYVFYVQFQTENGKTRVSTVPSYDFQSRMPKRGESVRVRYSKTQPSVMRFDSEWAIWSNSIFLGSIGIAFFFVPMLLRRLES